MCPSITYGGYKSLVTTTNYRATMERTWLGPDQVKRNLSALTVSGIDPFVLLIKESSPISAQLSRLYSWIHFSLTTKSSSFRHSGSSVHLYLVLVSIFLCLLPLRKPWVSNGQIQRLPSIPYFVAHHCPLRQQKGGWRKGSDTYGVRIGILWTGHFRRSCTASIMQSFIVKQDVLVFKGLLRLLCKCGDFRSTI